MHKQSRDKGVNFGVTFGLDLQGLSRTLLDKNTYSIPLLLASSVFEGTDTQIVLVSIVLTAASASLRETFHLISPRSILSIRGHPPNPFLSASYSCFRTAQKRTTRPPLGRPGCLSIFALRAGSNQIPFKGRPILERHSWKRQGRAGTQKQVVGGCPLIGNSADNPPGVNGLGHPTGVFGICSTNHLLTYKFMTASSLPEIALRSKLPVVLR